MIILTLIGIVLIDNYQMSKISKSGKESTQTDAGKTADTDGTDEEPEESDYVTLVALGQNCMNDSLIHSGQNEDGTADYGFMFAGVESYLQTADIAALCQGSVVAGNSLGVSGYPTYNAPEELCTAAVNAGINTVAMANIRVNNLGADGIISSLNLWKSKSDTIHVLGIHDSEEDNLTIVEANGLKIALLDYTAIIEKALGNDETYLVDIFGSYANGQADLSTLSEQTLADIDLADKTSDFVVVFASWGLDDTQEITATQERFAKQLTEAGADLIIGNRPNNLQKVEWITADNGNRALCYYSLGNFISSENTAGALIGGIAKVGIHVENGLTVIDEANTGLIPVVTQYTYSGTGDEVDVSGTVPFSQYTDEMAAGHGLTAKYGISLDRATVQGILDAVVPAEFLITE
jgi:poly-gamma-glutamate synthesis protein (capsule biosynthesis protein)